MHNFKNEVCIFLYFQIAIPWCGPLSFRALFGGQAFIASLELNPLTVGIVITQQNLATVLYFVYTATVFLRILITQQNIVTVVYFMYTVTVFLQGTLCPDERSRTQTLASRLVALFENVSDSRAQFQIEQQGKNNAQKHCKSL